jgi:CelD/BcsL family acetyltransferase involved in cellulose biosynthesis
VIAASQITKEMAAHWEEIRSRSPSLATPFFSSRYTKLVGNLRPDAKIAIAYRGGKIIGYLPFEQTNRSMIEPIGKAFNDAHGLICEAGEPIDYGDILKSLGLKSYRFHALNGPAIADRSYHLGSSPSFLADLEAHPEGYVSFLESTRETIYKQRRKTKKMIRDLGPLRLEIDCRDKAVLEALIGLKRDQYQRTYIFDILGVPWAQTMLSRLWEDHTAPCRGVLSALYAGDSLVAIHYGIMENGILHYWFPTYDRRYHQYSPGTAIFLEIANQASSIGIQKIDLGYGEQPYKHKFADTITDAPFGCISCCNLTFLRERFRLAVARNVKRIPGKPVLKKIVRGIWPSMGGSAFR